MHPEVRHGGEIFHRVTTPGDFARVLKSQGFGTRPIRLISCYGGAIKGYSVAQRLANAMGVDVYAVPGEISADEVAGFTWTRFQPYWGLF